MAQASADQPAESQLVFTASNNGISKEHANGMSDKPPSSQTNSIDGQLPSSNAKGPPFVVKLAIASLGVSTLFYVMLFIYLGASSNQTAYTQNLNVAVANFDVGAIGQAFTQFASNVPAGNGLPNFKVFYPPFSILVNE